MLYVPSLRQIAFLTVEPVSLMHAQGAMMSRDTLDAQQSLTTSPIEMIVSRVIQREFARDRAARQRSERRRAAAQRARHFDKLALPAVNGGNKG